MTKPSVVDDKYIVDNIHETTENDINDDDLNTRIYEQRPSINIFTPFLDIPFTYHNIWNEDAMELIITYWIKNECDDIFIPNVLLQLIIIFIPIAYQTEWSKIHKGADVSLKVDRTKAIISKLSGMQSIRAKNALLRYD